MLLTIPVSEIHFMFMFSLTKVESIRRFTSSMSKWSCCRKSEPQECCRN